MISLCICLDCRRGKASEPAKIEFQMSKMADMEYVNLFSGKTLLATVHMKDSIPVGIEFTSQNDRIIAFSDTDEDKVFDTIIVFDSDYNMIAYYQMKDGTMVDGDKKTIGLYNDVSKAFSAFAEEVKKGSEGDGK